MTSFPTVRKSMMLSTGCAIAACLVLSAAAAFAEMWTLTVEIWGDNWFATYVHSENVFDDSAPASAERSFNIESTSITATLPMTGRSGTTPGAVD